MSTEKGWRPKPKMRFSMYNSMQKCRDKLLKNNLMEARVFQKRWAKTYTHKLVLLLHQDSLLLVMTRTKLWCGGHWWRIVLSIMIIQDLIKKILWKGPFKLNMIAFLKMDGGHHLQVEETWSHGHAHNTIRDSKPEVLKKKDMYHAITTQDLWWNSVQTMIKSNQNLAI